MNTSRTDMAQRYLRALEAGAVGDQLAAFFTEDVVQEEYPNRLVPSGARRDLAALLDGAVRGQKVMRRQQFQVLGAVESGDVVVLEVQWIGTLAVPLGSLPAGGALRARFAVFLEYRGDRIAKQRNYDCFDAW